jgi:arylformamidase
MRKTTSRPKPAPLSTPSRTADAVPDADWLERMYNNRARVPAHAEHFARWARDSAAARAGSPCQLDLAYGDEPGETLDIFPAKGKDAPVLVFIHGGYWRSLDKADHSFVAPALTAAGACVVVPNYALCPAVTIPQITMQMVHALAWVWRHIAAHGGDPRRITVVGHSAGAHLAAMLMACDWAQAGQQLGLKLPARLVKNALLISGLYELESVRRTPSLQEVLRLTPADALRASPAWLPAPARGTLATVVGAEESEEFIRHNKLIRSAWGPRKVPVCESLPGLQHFSIVEALAQPGHRLHQLACQLLAA